MSLRAPTIVSPANAAVLNYGELANTDASLGPIVVNLPRPSIGLASIRIRKLDATSNIVTVVPSTGTIDEAAAFDLLEQYSYLEVIPDGSNWWIVALANIEASLPPLPPGVLDIAGVGIGLRRGGRP